jgi:hypothetical protein
MVACRSPKSRGACSSQAIPVTLPPSPINWGGRSFPALLRYMPYPYGDEWCIDRVVATI